VTARVVTGGAAAWQATECDVLVACAARSAPALIEIADVIICPDRLRGPGPVTMLRYYPGCLVAAVGLGGGACLVAARAGQPARIVLACSPPDSAAHGSAHSSADRNLSALLCALFAVSWMTVGWPVHALDRTRLRLDDQATPAGWRNLPYEGLISVSLAVPGGPPDAKPRADCRCLISAASGALASA
jgi:hypothetical protein